MVHFAETEECLKFFSVFRSKKKCLLPCFIKRKIYFFLLTVSNSIIGLLRLINVWVHSFAKLYAQYFNCESNTRWINENEWSHEHVCVRKMWMIFWNVCVLVRMCVYSLHMYFSLVFKTPSYRSLCVHDVRAHLNHLLFLLFFFFEELKKVHTNFGFFFKFFNEFIKIILVDFLSKRRLHKWRIFKMCK